MDSSALVRVPCPLCAATKSRPERVVEGYNLERCCRCGFVFANPQCPPDGLDKQYSDRSNPDGLINHYALVTSPGVMAEFTRILTDLEAWLPARGRLLDFGCGACYFVELAAQRGWQAHGIDLGRWSRRAAERRGVRNIHIGLLQDQDFSPEYFEVVHTAQVLEHLPNPRETLKQFHRLLRPQGLLYINVPNYQTLPILLDCDDFELNSPMGHVNYFTPRTLQAMVRSCGFEVERVATYGGLKWENLLGRRVNFVQTEARRRREAEKYVAEFARIQAFPNSGEFGYRFGVPPLWKRWTLPLLRTLFYRLGKVGISLELFARKRDSRKPR